MSTKFGLLIDFKMAAVRHLGFVMTSQYCIAGQFRCPNIVLKFIVDRCCNLRDTCNVISQPIGCT